MRRGLMAWNADEVPAEALAARLARLRAEMQARGLDGFIAYTNFPRPAAVTWLTAFTPYWADAVLYVPREGEPVFATALSKRVANWINSVKPVGELVNTPRPGQLVGQRIAQEATARTIGVLEFDALPNYIADDLAAAAPGVAFVEGAPVFAAARRELDAAERGLIDRADTIARAALARVAPGTMTTAGAVVGAVEQAARLAGAEEAYVHLAPDLAARTNLARMSGDGPLGARFAVRASVAYKGSWVRRTRTFARDAADAARCDEAEAWLAQTLAGLRPGVPLARQIAAAADAFGATLTDVLAESSIGSYPLQAVASSQTDSVVQAGALLVVTVRLARDGAPWIGGAPTVVGSGPT